MITYKSRFLTRSEVWFDDEPGDTGSSDWILYNQRTNPVPGADCRYFYTYCIDLTPSREELLARFNKDTAYKIRRARERDKIICECCDPSDPAILAAKNFALTGTADATGTAIVSNLTADMIGIRAERLNSQAGTLSECDCSSSGCDASTGPLS